MAEAKNESSIARDKSEWRKVATICYWSAMHSMMSAEFKKQLSLDTFDPTVETPVKPTMGQLHKAAKTMGTWEEFQEQKYGGRKGN